MKEETSHRGTSQQDRKWLQRQAVELLFSVGLFPFMAHIVIVCLVCWVLWPATHHASLILWAGVLSLGIVAQIGFLWWARRKPMDQLIADKVLLFFNVFGGFVGVSWATLFIFLFPENDYFLAVFLAFSAGGLAMGGVATQHMIPVGTITSVVVALGTLSARYLLSDIQNPLIHGLGLALYMTVLVDLTLRLNKVSLRAASLQLEQQHLLTELSQKTEALEEARYHADSARHQAELASDAKSRFLAQASHDLRQPLHAANLLLAALPGTKNRAARTEIMNRVQQSLDVLTKLFDSLLDVTLIDTGGIQVNRKTFRMNDLMVEVLEDFQSIAASSETELRHVKTSTVVQCDPVLLRRMLQNLISNAIRHSAGGAVLVGCRHSVDKLILQVSDNGSGIAEQDQQKIFAEFERLDDARIGDAATPGLGLGLAIVQRIAKELDLAIDLKSKENHGSTFSIGNIDVVESDVKEQPLFIVDNKPISKDINVFVLDDDPETLRATELLLHRWGYKVDVSQDWRDLMEATPDVIICDFEVSSMKNGLQVLREFRDAVDPEIPAIIISGHTSKLLRTQAAVEGIPLIHKPILPVQLRSALLNALAGHDSPREAANEAAAARLGKPKVRSIAET